MSDSTSFNLEESLKKLFGQENVSFDPLDLTLYGRDCMPTSILKMQAGAWTSQAKCVVWPTETRQISELLKLAQTKKFDVIPFGAGSGVCGGTEPVSPAVIVDMKRMDKVLDFDPYSKVVTVQCGIILEHLERYLNARGHTLGHFPSSIYCCTVGGNLATRSAGQMSSKYGKIEDMVIGLEVVMPTGSVVRVRPAPRRSTGPDLIQLFVGSEGTFGIITEATLRIWKLPEERIFAAFKFPDVKSGISAMREIMQSDIKPSVVRFYDELDTAFSGAGKEEGGILDILPIKEAAQLLRSIFPGLVRAAQRAVLSRAELLNLIDKVVKEGCLMILVFEGNRKLAKLEFEEAKNICDKNGAEYLGPAPAQKWYQNRYSISYKQSKVFYMGAFVDTIEVATSWDKLSLLYSEIKAAISRHALVLAHFSHAYVDGCSIYFTFVTSGLSLEDRLKVHKEIWESAMKACLRVGATISHHHGVGLVRSSWMQEELSSSFVILDIIKSGIDPSGVMNPYKLGFDKRPLEEK